MFEIDTKRKVTKREYNNWVKWLRTQGYSGSFAGLKPSHEWVKRLAKELRKYPRTILETRPRDQRTIASNLTRYERKHRQQMPEDLDREIVGYKLYNQRHYEHWGRLAKLTEELKQSLELPKDIKVVDTYFCWTFQQSWYCHEGNIYFSAQHNPLWECLLQHLDNEFEQPHFSYELKEFQEAAAQLVNGKLEGHPVMARSYQLAQSLSYKLWVVIERVTFRGTCDICREWNCSLP